MDNIRDIEQQRRELRGWLREDDPAQALFAYYFLYHPANRVRLHVSHDKAGRVNGALAECVTGYDLFRPLVVMLAEDEAALSRLILEGVPRQRPFFLLGSLSYESAWAAHVSLSDSAIYRLCVLDRAHFEPIINVLVTSAQSPDGLPRFEIRAPAGVMAAASLNWRSPRFAEIGVYTEPAVRGRRWGESVVSALCASLLQEGITPLYLADEDNEASQRLAERVGFRDTGRRLLFAAAQWKQAGSPGE